MDKENPWVIGTTSVTWNGTTLEVVKNKEQNIFIPWKIIYNDPYTICYFLDGSKVIVKCMEGETYSKEIGVAECIMKKIFKERAKFVKLVESGYTPKKKE